MLQGEWQLGHMACGAQADQAEWVLLEWRRVSYA